MTNNKIVCVAVDHKYSDNNGAWSEFYLFDGVNVWTEGGMYSDLAYNTYEVDASHEQIVEAAKIANAKKSPTNNYNKYANNRSGAYTYVGCIVKLSRSRKAPNKRDLKVVAFHDRFFNSHFNSWVNESIDLIDEEGNRYDSVSTNCISEVVQGVIENEWWTPA